MRYADPNLAPSDGPTPIRMIIRVVEHFARPGSGWCVTGVSNTKVMLRWTAAVPFDHAAEQARAVAAPPPGMSVAVRTDGRAVARPSRWTA